MSAPAATSVTSSGQIIVDNVPNPAEQIMKQPANSLITAAASKVAAQTAIQNKAVTTLGQKGGATQVTVHPPTMVTAGTSTSHPNDLYANLYSIKAQGQTDASYDSLHSAQPMKIGGKRKTLKRKHKKHARTQSKGNRQHKRHSRKRRHVRHSRRRLHEHK